MQNYTEDQIMAAFYKYIRTKGIIVDSEVKKLKEYRSWQSVQLAKLLRDKDKFQLEL